MPITIVPGVTDPTIDAMLRFANEFSCRKCWCVWALDADEVRQVVDEIATGDDVEPADDVIHIFDANEHNGSDFFVISAPCPTCGTPATSPHAPLSPFRTLPVRRILDALYDLYRVVVGPDAGMTLLQDNTGKFETGALSLHEATRMVGVLRDALKERQ